MRELCRCGCVRHCVSRLLDLTGTSFTSGSLKWGWSTLPGVATAETFLDLMIDESEEKALGIHPVKVFISL